MRKSKLITLLVLAFAVKAFAASASELGHTAPISDVQLTPMAPSAPPILSAANLSAAMSGTFTGTPTGSDSITLVGAVVRQAATIQQKNDAIKNTRITNAKKNVNVSTTGVKADGSPNCRRIAAPGNTSCYGVGDGFAGRLTKVGTRYNIADTTIALNSYQLLGQIVVIKNPAQGKARCATVTDTGSFGQRYSRIADLSDALVRQFGSRCSPITGSFKGMEIYVCSDGCPAAAN